MRQAILQASWVLARAHPWTQLPAEIKHLIICKHILHFPLSSAELRELMVPSHPVCTILILSVVDPMYLPFVGK